MLHLAKIKFFLKEKLETNAMEVAKEKLKLFQLQVLLKFKLMQFKEIMRSVFSHRGKWGGIWTTGCWKTKYSVNKIS